MATMEDIESVSEAIAREFNPKKIVLFGSYAWGTPTPDSDVDLLVVLPFEGKSWRMATAIREKIPVSFPLDLLARTEDQIRERLRIHDSFVSEIISKGKVLYEN